MVLKHLKLTLTYTRLSGNYKIDIYHGEYYGEKVEALKVYKRHTALHPFKFVRELFKCESHQYPFVSVDNMKQYIKRNAPWLK